MKSILASLVSAFCAVGALAQDLPTVSATAHLKETSTVVGVVAQVSEKKGNVFINFDRPFPKHSFTAFVPQPKFAAAGDVPYLLSLQGKMVAVNGKIVDYNSCPEIVVASADQIFVR